MSAPALRGRRHLGYLVRTRTTGNVENGEYVAGEHNTRTSVRTLHVLRLSERWLGRFVISWKSARAKPRILNHEDRVVFKSKVSGMLRETNQAARRAQVRVAMPCRRGRPDAAVKCHANRRPTLPRTLLFTLISHASFCRSTSEQYCPAGLPTPLRLPCAHNFTSSKTETLNTCYARVL